MKFFTLTFIKWLVILGISNVVIFFAFKHVNIFLVFATLWIPMEMARVAMLKIGYKKPCTREALLMVLISTAPAFLLSFINGVFGELGEEMLRSAKVVGSFMMLFLPIFIAASFNFFSASRWQNDLSEHIIKDK